MTIPSAQSIVSKGQRLKLKTFAMKNKGQVRSSRTRVSTISAYRILQGWLNLVDAELEWGNTAYILQLTVRGLVPLASVHLDNV